MAPPDTTVFVIDDEESIRKALTRILRTEGYACETFSSAEGFLEAVDPRRPGCAIVDMMLPGLNGFDVQSQLSSGARRMPVVFLSGQGSIPDSVKAMKAGACDFLTKPVRAAALLQAIESALASAGPPGSGPAGTSIDKLTMRESQVMEGVVSGLLNKEIGARLGIAEKTVKVHRGRMMKKMGVRSVADLVRMTRV